MPQVALFPFGEYWWFYLAFTALVILLLLLDLGIFHREAHKVSMREAAGWSVVWVSLALAFNVAFYFYMLRQFPLDPRLAGLDAAALAKQTALEFLAGYVVEYSLSVDNIFVFVVVLTYFGVPAQFQHRVLFFGILGALVFRAIFIALGALLLQFEWVIWLFGGFLILTGARMMFGPEEGPVEPHERWVIRAFRRHVPVTESFRGASFFVREQVGRLHATPLFIALLFLEMTDIVFAVDSVPAIFGLTREPLVVFTSNIFAILGLRNLYFLLAGAVDKFHMLKYGLGIVLIFVGLKMAWLNRLFEGHFPIGISLGIIIGTIAVSVVLSLVFPKAQESP
ncbi:MAG TPA: TerC/Alx family metal homeostasis membrane protein [Vicinamibacteria bacterium]|nr:TerC/Alx family metal homeostasis membrane protein [Vicinamibacteria bacterium]